MSGAITEHLERRTVVAQQQVGTVLSGDLRRKVCGRAAAPPLTWPLPEVRIIPSVKVLPPSSGKLVANIRSDHPHTRGLAVYCVHWYGRPRTDAYPLSIYNYSFKRQITFRKKKVSK